MNKQFQFSGLSLKFLRMIHGITSTQLAKKLKCTTALISIIEVGKHKMSARDTRTTLELFGITSEQAESFTAIINEVKGGHKHERN